MSCDSSCDYKTSCDSDCDDSCDSDCDYFYCDSDCDANCIYDQISTGNSGVNDGSQMGRCDTETILGTLALGAVAVGR